MASLVGRVEDLVVEHREVEGQTKTDRMGRSEVGLSDFRGALVGLERGIGGSLAAVANGKLGQVAVVVSFPVTRLAHAHVTLESDAHLVVKDLGLASLGRGDQVLVEHLEDIVADLSKFRLDLLAVLLDEGDLGLIPLGFLLLFDGGDNPPRRASRTNDILVCDGKQVSLLDSELNIGSRNDLHVLDHF